MTITPDQLRTFWKEIDAGAAKTHAASKAGFSRGSADKIVRDGRGRDLVKPRGKGREHAWQQRATTRQHGGPVDDNAAPDPIAHEDLCDEAKEALVDFNFFSERYFGRAPTPWRAETAERIFELYDDDHKHFGVVNAPPGVGKPLLASTLVSMSDGSRKPIGDIEVGDWVVSAEGRHCPVTAVHDQGVLDVFRVVMESGREVVAAGDHPFLTERGWVNAEDLLDGDVAPVVPFDPVVGSYPSAEEFRLAGYFVGDGCTVQGNANITTDDIGVSDDVEHCLAHLGWTARRTDDPRPKAKAWTLSAKGDGLHRHGPRAWLAQHGMRDKTSHTKRVPDFVFAAPNRLAAEFIGAYLACDGTVGENAIEFYSVNRELLADVQSLLSRFGIQSAVRPKRGRYKGEVHMSWRLVVRHRRRFAEVIPVKGRKGPKLREVSCQAKEPDLADVVAEVVSAGSGDCFCLTVDSDHTFLAGDLPVHNSALFTHDIPAWLTVRRRAVRGVLGSWGMRPAEAFTRRLRTTLERSALVPTSDDLIAKGLEREPSGILARDFGRFKPLGQSDFWTAQAFTVDQLDGRAVADKEPTWTAFGNGEILGWRVDLMIWDDLVTTKKLSSEAEQEKLHVWWLNEVEKRLEPGGLLVLQGQRLGANDLYRFCLDQIDVDDIEDIDAVDPDDPNNDVPRKYHHIVFKAHYDELCTDTDDEGNKHHDHHPSTAKPYPEGCLLDPLRLTFRDTRREQMANPALYATVYQQEDTNPDQVLIPKHWIDGDDEHPGCWDKDRDAWEIPDGMSGPWISVVSVDPSPTKSWAIQSWLYHPASETYFLLDLYRGQMEAPSFLYGDEKRGSYSGMLEDIRKDFLHMGIPLRHVIFEKNVAQRWFLQMPYVEGWRRKHQVTIHDQETHHRNKADPDYGITMLRPLFKGGNIRLPGKQVPYGGNSAMHTGRRNAIKLVNELTRYSLQFGAAGTDDQIMACWFMCNKAQKLRKPNVDEMPRLNPSAPRWMRRRGKAA